MKKQLFAYLLLAFSINMLCAQIYTEGDHLIPDSIINSFTSTAAAADFDGDGKVDIVLGRDEQSDLILFNVGSAEFVVFRQPFFEDSLISTQGALTSDFDNDGNVDILFAAEEPFLQTSIRQHSLYFNDGDGNFSPGPYSFPWLNSREVVSLDLNGDSLDDVIFLRDGSNQFFINNGDSTFTAINSFPQSNAYSTDCSFRDLTGDGNPELFEFGISFTQDANRLYVDQGNGNYRDESRVRIAFRSGVVVNRAIWADVDSDGDMDLFCATSPVTFTSLAPELLFINDGNGRFSNRTGTQFPSQSSFSFDAVFEDIDRDGDMDIITGNAGVNGIGAEVKAFFNDGNGNFTDATRQVFGQGYITNATKILLEDFNNDGFNDLFIHANLRTPSLTKSLLLLRDPQATVSIEKDIKQNFSMHRDPGSGAILIKTNYRLDNKAKILDYQGRELTKVTFVKRGNGLYSSTQNVFPFPAGMYLVRTNLGTATLLIK